MTDSSWRPPRFVDTMLSLGEVIERWGVPGDLVEEELTPYVRPGLEVLYSLREAGATFGPPLHSAPRSGRSRRCSAAGRWRNAR